MRDRRRGSGPEWEDATEPVPGDFRERSVELGVELQALGREWDGWSSSDAGHVTIAREDVEALRRKAFDHFWPKTDHGEPDLVVFEPNTSGLVTRLRALGYTVREAPAGVDVMTLVAERPTAAVVIGVVLDAERRRLLTGALKVRFPHVPVVYVTGHAISHEGVQGALREGAQAVIPWPLPADTRIDASLQPFVRPDLDWRGRVRANAADADLDADPDAELAETVELKLGSPPPRGPAPVDLGTLAGGSGGAGASGFEESIETLAEVRAPLALDDELPVLLRALGPFVWNMRDTARYLQERVDEGDARALDHARSLKTIARILEQLLERVDGDSVLR